MNVLSLVLLSLASFITLGAALECYTCFNQDTNKDKCIKTVKQCEKDQNACKTHIIWGIPAFWTPHGERIFKLTKDCDRFSDCMAESHFYRTKCKRDWYRDWECVECCSGDMCNYYSTLDGSLIKSNLVTMVVGLIVILYLQWR